MLKRLSALVVIAAIVAAPVSHGSEEAGESSAQIPIVMYHCVSKNPGLLGKYCITPQELENDLVYLRKNGFECVVFADILAFANEGRALPEKPVMLTFDDGNFSDYKYLFPMLEKYNMKAVVSILGKEADTYSADGRTDIIYPNLIWAQIREMNASGFVEIQSHSYNMHGESGAGKRRGETDEQYAGRFTSDLARLQERVQTEIGRKPAVFAYPKGIASRRSDELLRELGFSGSFGCEEGVNTVRIGEPESLFRMKRIVRPHGKSIGEVLAKYACSATDSAPKASARG